jgi:hypothetical protein
MQMLIMLSCESSAEECVVYDELISFFRIILCQNTQLTVKIKQKPVTVGVRTTYRIMSPKRTHFQSRIDKRSYL